MREPYVFRHKKLVATQKTLTKNPHLICEFKMRRCYSQILLPIVCPLTMTLVDIPEAVYTMAFGGVATGSMNA